MEGVGGDCPDKSIQDEDKTRQHTTKPNDPQATETHRPTCCLSDSSRPQATGHRETGPHLLPDGLQQGEDGIRWG